MLNQTGPSMGGAANAWPGLRTFIISSLLLIVLNSIPSVTRAAVFWTPMTSNTTQDLNAIWGTASNNIFAVGRGGTILHYNGSSWTAMASNTTFDLYDVWGTSATNVYAVGSDSSGNGYVTRYNGTSWSEVVNNHSNLWVYDETNTAQLALAQYGIWGTSATNIHTAGGFSISGTSLFYGGGNWLIPNTPFRWRYGMFDVDGTTNDMVQVGYATARKKGAAAWEIVDTLFSRAVDITDADEFRIVGRDPGVIVYYQCCVAGGAMYTRNENAGTTENLYDISLPYAVGANGAIVNRVVATWRPMTSGTNESLLGIWVLSLNDVFVVGANGTILHGLPDAQEPTTAANPGTGTYMPRDIALDCVDAGGSGCATTYYCTGAACTPTTVYSSPITINTTTTLRFYSVDVAGNAESVIKSANITIDTIPPSQPNVSGPAATADTTPTWTWTQGGGDGIGTFRLKLDDPNPVGGWQTTMNMLYTPPALAGGSHTIYVQERDAAGNWSATGTATTFIDTQGPTSSSTPAAGTFSSAISVSLECDDGMGVGCSTTYYTTNGDVPTTASAVFDPMSPIAVGDDMTIRFFSTDSAMQAGPIVDASFDINIAPPKGSGGSGCSLGGNSMASNELDPTLPLVMIGSLAGAFTRRRAGRKQK